MRSRGPVRIQFISSYLKDESGVTGSVPELVFDEERSFLDSLHKTSVELMNMKRVCSNALQQYRKSRPTASAESNKRMKSLLKETVWYSPLFGLNNKPRETSRSVT